MLGTPYDLQYIIQCDGLHAILGGALSLSAAVLLLSWTPITSLLTSPDRRISRLSWVFFFSVLGLASSFSHWSEDMTLNWF
jgi:hypothetical protein